MPLTPQKKHLFLWIFLISVNSIFAQETEINANTLAKFNHAIKLYNSKAYMAAQKEFEDVSREYKNNTNIVADADYYDAMCAIRLHQTDADQKMLAFVKNHPNSNKKEKAYLNVGNHYFANKKAAYALKWYKKVNPNLLAIEDKKELDFKMGYALLVTNYLTQAKKKFINLLTDAKYGDDARYYYGYIAYKQEEYDIAEATLTEIADKQAYNEEVTYYLLDISFKAGRFKRCIVVGKKLLEKAKKREKSNISKIIGESYFNLQQYDEALPFLLNYKGKKGKWTNTDYYQLGYVYYKQKEYQKALTYFNKIIDEPNAVGQNAYYHLAECYLNLKMKPEALNAFKSASQLSFDAKIKEDAFLNYAKLSYEQGNPYKSVPEVLQDFLTAYPKSKHYNEINQLIVTSFINEKDFKGALAYLDKKKSSENTELKKEVSLYQGITLFNIAKFKEALPFFETGTTATKKAIKNKSKYWLAETHYQLQDYQKAFDEFLSVTNTKTDEFKNLNYNLGYSLFKLKKYEEAKKYFNQYTKETTEPSDFKDDATLRLADCYFGTKNYDKAINIYDKIIENYSAGSDYALYQKAMSYGLLGNNEEKVTTILSLVNQYKESSFKDDALFQLGITYTNLKDTEKAHKAYEKLINEHPKSSYIPRTLLRDGLLYYNDNKYNKAISKYKEIVAKYANTNEAKEAVANAKNVYVDTGNVDEYANWVNTLQFANITDAEIENTMFEAAENKFLENKTDKAIKGFKKYLTKFPFGAYALKTNDYLAQLYTKNNQLNQAIPNYQFIINQNQNEFSENALNKLSQIYLEKENWKDAMPLLERLEVEANYPKNIQYAQSNLMKGYYNAENYEKAVTYAEKVLNSDKINKQLEADAKIIVARAAFKTDDMQRAEEFFTEVSRNATGKLKAEALYYDAYFKHNYKEYKESNKVIQNLIANYAAYKYWAVKSYVIMAKNYYALKDAYQATFILENIIKNFSQFEDIITDAKKELKKIKTNEAKTNGSVTPQK